MKWLFYVIYQNKAGTSDQLLVPIFWVIFPWKFSLFNTVSMNKFSMPYLLSFSRRRGFIFKWAAPHGGGGIGFDGWRGLWGTVAPSAFQTESSVLVFRWMQSNSVLCNVGLLCNIVPGTFLCILGINYAMLTS